MELPGHIPKNGEKKNRNNVDGAGEGSHPVSGVHNRNVPERQYWRNT